MQGVEGDIMRELHQKGIYCICDQLCVCSGAQGDIIIELHQTGKYTLYVYMGGG